MKVEKTMSTHFHEVTEDFALALRAMKAGKQVVLTEQGVPVGTIQPIRPASAEEEQTILEMIDSGDLRLTRKSGTVKEWK